MSAPAWPPVWMTVAPGGDELDALAGIVTASHGMSPANADRLAVTLDYLRARLRGLESSAGWPWSTPPPPNWPRNARSTPPR